jgi:hypothetical protein
MKDFTKVIKDECKFSGSGFNRNHELGECSLAFQVIPYCESVLEIGGGAGKVSHMINILLKNPLKHVVIEPGKGGRGNHGDEHLWKNQKYFNDKYTIIKKYANDLVTDDLKMLGDNGPECLYVDCEGCLLSFLTDSTIGKTILKSKKLKYIVNEMDGFTSKIPEHDEKLKTLLSNNGFVIHAKGAGCGVKCETLVWKKHESPHIKSFLQSNKNVFMFMFAILLLVYSMYIM